MSLDYREQVMRDALKLGVPCVRRVGRVIALCTAVRKRIDGGYEGDCRAWEAPSGGFAKQFVERAVHESGWKCAQHVEAPRVFPADGGVG